MHQPDDPILLGRRIKLRQLDSSEFGENYLDWMNDTDVVRYTESRHCSYTHKDLVNYVKSTNESAQDHLFGIFTIEEDEHIGNIKIGQINDIHNTASLGLIIGKKECWGQGYGAEAIRLIEIFAFQFLRLEKLTAGVIEGNDASLKTFQKAGFVIEGVKRKQNQFEGERRDEIILGLLKEEWFEAKQ